MTMDTYLTEKTNAAGRDDTKMSSAEHVISKNNNEGLE